ncbi:ODF3A protein, partial [Turnix velox]|nr:ODF3A protein [Turnix velox]
TTNMNGALMGSWRPQRPRALITAQFTSPGPKYTIPGSTGHLAHNATKARAPAVTFQGARSPVPESCSPGLCYCLHPSFTGMGKYVGPAQHICGWPQVKMEVTPGPSEYFFPSTFPLPHQTSTSCFCPGTP